MQHAHECREPLTAIRDDPQYMAVSDYASQLKPYLQHFGVANVHALTFEQLVHKPVEITQTVYDWLGVDASFVPADIEVPVNVTPATLMQRRAWTMRLTQSSMWRAIRDYRPDALRGRMAELKTKSVRPDQVPMDDVIRFLRPIQRAQTERLEGLIKRGFPEWQTLYGDLPSASAPQAEVEITDALVRRTV